VIIEVPCKLQDSSIEAMEDVCGVSFDADLYDDMLCLNTDRICYFFACNEDQTQVIFSGCDVIVDVKYDEFKELVKG